MTSFVVFARSLFSRVRFLFPLGFFLSIAKGSNQSAGDRTGGVADEFQTISIAPQGPNPRNKYILDRSRTQQLGENIQELGAKVGQVGVRKMTAIELPQMFFEGLPDLGFIELDQLPAFHSMFLWNHRVQGHLDRRVILGPVSDEFTEQNLARNVLFGQRCLIANDTNDARVHHHESKNEGPYPIFANCFQHAIALQSNRGAIGAVRHLETVGRDYSKA